MSDVDKCPLCGEKKLAIYYYNSEPDVVCCEAHPCKYRVDYLAHAAITAHIHELEEKLQGTREQRNDLQAELAAIRPRAEAMECRNCDLRGAFDGCIHQQFGRDVVARKCPKTGIREDCPLVAGKRKEMENAS